MFKKLSKLLLFIYIFGAMILNSWLSAATIHDSVQQSNVAQVPTVSIIADEKGKTTPVPSNATFWGLGIALIGFIALSRRRGI